MTSSATAPALQRGTSSRHGPPRRAPQVIVPDQDILAMYQAVGGYNPGDPSTDQGAVELDVLNYWRKNPLSGHELSAYATLHPRETEEIRQAIY